MPCRSSTPSTCWLPRLSPLAPLERKIKRRLARGSQHVDGVLDLHGMTQAAAHGALTHFIHRMHAQGGQLAIVITGKGRMSPQNGYASEGGVLRRHTPDWLRAPDLRHMVIGFEEAAAPHGGAGALYVRIRRRAVRG
jgi:DNA-nicking Smr family endonuclease